MLRDLFREIRKEKRLFLAVLLLVLVNAAATLAPAEAGQRLVRLLEKGQYGWIVTVALFLLAAVLVKTGSDFLRQYTAGYLGQKLSVTLQRRVHDKFLKLPAAYFKNRESGELLSRTTNDINEVRQFYAAHLPDCIKNPLLLAAGLVALFLKNWLFTLEILLAGLFILLATHLVGSRIRRAAQRVRESLGRVTTRLQESLFSIEIIKSFGREPHHRARFDASLDEYLHRSKKEIALDSAIRPVNEFLSSLAAVAVVGTGIHLIGGGRMTGSELAGFVLYLAVLSAPLNALSHVAVQYKRACASHARIREVLEAAEEDARLELPALHPGPGHLEFRGVHFRYKEKEPVLRGVSFTVRPGEMIALVGPSGCGKTTLVNLLPRLVDPDRGRILLDGQDTARVNLPSLRARIGMVAQESVLFQGSVMENIRYGKLDAGDAAVVAAAKAAGADRFIRGFKNGYGTLIGERGLLLSGGQRQRLALARVLLRDPAVLILDEATSALDSENERAVQRAILAAAKSRTTLVIAHRLSTVRDADRILVMERGRIVQEGRHAALVRKPGLYRRLYEGQLR